MQDLFRSWSSANVSNQYPSPILGAVCMFSVQLQIELGLGNYGKIARMGFSYDSTRWPIRFVAGLVGKYASPGEL
jgi:hypothetical protein